MCQIQQLYHHGIKGQKWGVRNGPPYPISGEKKSVSDILKKIGKWLINDEKSNKSYNIGNKWFMEQFMGQMIREQNNFYVRQHMNHMNRFY